MSNIAASGFRVGQPLCCNIPWGCRSHLRFNICSLSAVGILRAALAAPVPPRNFLRKPSLGALAGLPIQDSGQGHRDHHDAGPSDPLLPVRSESVQVQQASTATTAAATNSTRASAIIARRIYVARDVRYAVGGGGARALRRS